MKEMITILGPTASGKTPLTAALACALPKVDGGVGAEIISADSRQVYRRMDIGTGKDLADYRVAPPAPAAPAAPTVVGGSPADTIPYHLIDIAEPGTKYNLFQYQRDFVDAYHGIIGRGRVPILCGGTGLYIEAVLKGYQLSPVPQNPELRAQLEGKSLEELTQMLVELKARNGSNMHNTTDVDTPQRAIRAIEIELGSMEDRGRGGTEVRGYGGTEERGYGGTGVRGYENSSASGISAALPSIPSLIIGVHIDREERRRKITRRLKARLEDGMIDEVRGLLDEGIAADDLIYYGLEYKFVTEYVLGCTTYDEMFSRLEIAIHQFAKRQMTWFRGMERRGFTIHWVDAMLPMEEKVQAILKYMKM